MDQHDRMNPPQEPEGEDWSALWTLQCQKCVTCRLMCDVAGCLASVLSFSLLPWFLSLPVFLFAFLLPSLANVFFPSLYSLIANMAHSSSRRRTVPERSRSRDDFMWQNRRTEQPVQQYHPWPEDPHPPPRLRKVLAIVDLQEVRPLMNKTHDDSMAATTCAVIPRLSRVEECALLQCLAQHTSVGNLHGVQPIVLHQPTYLVHVGSIPTSVIHGYPMARRYWRYIRSPQWGPLGSLSQCISSSLDWRTRT